MFYAGWRDDDQPALRRIRGGARHRSPAQGIPAAIRVQSVQGKNGQVRALSQKTACVARKCGRHESELFEADAHFQKYTGGNTIIFDRQSAWNVHVEHGERGTGARLHSGRRVADYIEPSAQGGSHRARFTAADYVQPARTAASFGEPVVQAIGCTLHARGDRGEAWLLARALRAQCVTSGTRVCRVRTTASRCPFTALCAARRIIDLRAGSRGFGTDLSPWADSAGGRRTRRHHATRTSVDLWRIAGGSAARYRQAYRRSARDNLWPWCARANHLDTAVWVNGEMRCGSVSGRFCERWRVRWRVAPEAPCVPVSTMGSCRGFPVAVSRSGTHF